MTWLDVRWAAAMAVVVVAYLGACLVLAALAKAMADPEPACEVHHAYDDVHHFRILPRAYDWAIDGE